LQVFWTLLSSLMFATMSLLVKVAAGEFAIPTILFSRALPGALLMIAYALFRGLPIKTPHWKMHAVRNVVGISSLLLGFYAVSRLPLATASCLDYTAPIFMTLYAVALRRHRPTRVEFLALIGGFAGVVLLLRPTAQQDDLVPFAAGLAGGALAAIVYLQIRRLGRAGEPLWRIVFIYSATGVVVSALAMPFTPSHPHSGEGVLALLGVGVTGLVAQMAMTKAYSQGTPTLVATLQYSTVVFSAVYGYVLWDDRLSLASTAGLALIVVSGTLVAWHVRATALIDPVLAATRRQTTGEGSRTRRGTERRPPAA
jgi:S-adenosylmethionine uptake transporter